MVHRNIHINDNNEDDHVDGDVNVNAPQINFWKPTEIHTVMQNYTNVVFFLTCITEYKLRRTD